MVNSCGGNTAEGQNEFFTFRNGPNPLDLNTWIVTFPGGGGNMYCNSGCGGNNWQIPNPSTAAIVANLTAGCPGTIVEPPGGIIPPFGWVIAFCGANPVFTYNFCGSCNVGPIYAVFTTSTSTVGKFSNTAARTLIADFGGGCHDTVSYDPVNFSPSNTDGNYVAYDVFTGTATYLTQSCPGCIALPVRLVDFYSSAGPNGLNLNWNFAPDSELPEFLTLQRSKDGYNFTDLSAYAPAQESRFTYTFNDTESNSGLRYYRISYRTLSGETHHSQILKVSASRNLNSETLSLLLSPNPATAFLNIQYTLQASSPNIEISLRILNLQGQLLKESSHRGISLQGTIPLDLSSLSQGMYLLELEQGGKKVVERFVVQR